MISKTSLAIFLGILYLVILLSQEEMTFNCDFLAKKFGKEFLGLIDESNKTDREVSVPICRPWTDLEGKHLRLGKKDVGTAIEVKPEEGCSDGEEYMGNFHTHPPSSAYGLAIPSVRDLHSFNSGAIKYGLRGPFCIGGAEAEMSCVDLRKLDLKDFDDYVQLQKSFEKCENSKSAEQVKAQCIKPFKEKAEKILKKYPYCTTILRDQAINAVKPH